MESMDCSYFHDPKKRHSQTNPVSNKKPKPSSPTTTSQNNDVILELSLDEDELSKLLDTPTCPTPCPVKFSACPYVSAPAEYSYVTINGNEETCGSSFSDTHASVMVSFDNAGVKVVDPVPTWGSVFGGGVETGRSDEFGWNGLLFSDHQSLNEQH